MDELAYTMKMDPVKLRAINEPEKDPTKNTEFSHRDMKLAFTKGAEKFGWRYSEPRSKKDGDWLIGHGVQQHIILITACRLRRKCALMQITLQ